MEARLQIENVSCHKRYVMVKDFMVVSEVNIPAKGEKENSQSP
jgi:hypothetical protein